MNSARRAVRKKQLQRSALFFSSDARRAAHQPLGKQAGQHFARGAGAFITMAAAPPPHFSARAPSRISHWLVAPCRRHAGLLAFQKPRRLDPCNERNSPHRAIPKRYSACRWADRGSGVDCRAARFGGSFIPRITPCGRRGPSCWAREQWRCSSPPAFLSLSPLGPHSAQSLLLKGSAPLLAPPGGSAAQGLPLPHDDVSAAPHADVSTRPHCCELGQEPEGKRPGRSGLSGDRRALEFPRERAGQAAGPTEAPAVPEVAGRVLGEGGCLPGAWHRRQVPDWGAGKREVQFPMARWAHWWPRRPIRGKRQHQCPGELTAGSCQLAWEKEKRIQYSCNACLAAPTSFANRRSQQPPPPSPCPSPRPNPELIFDRCAECQLSGGDS